MELNATNQDLLWELVLAMEINLQRLGLFLAVCDQDLLRAEIIERSQQELAAQGIFCLRVRLDQAEPSLYRAVRESLETRETTEQPLMVMVEGSIGLSTEVTAEADKSPFAKFLGYLQWTREAMREFELPIVIWVNGEVYDEIVRQAPDFFSWRQGVFFFERQPINVIINSENENLKISFGQAREGTSKQSQFASAYNSQEVWDQLLLEATLELVTQREANNQYDANLAKLYEFVAEQYQKSLATYSEAVATWEKAIALHRKLSLKEREGWNLISLGLLLYNYSDFIGAQKRCELSLEIAREIADRELEASSLGNLGLTYDSLGEYERAIAFHQQSLEIEREMGNRQGEASSLNSLGLDYENLGEYERAITSHQQSLEIQREIGNRRGEASSIGNLGNAYLRLGEYERAITFHQQSLEIEREIGNITGEAASLHNMALCLEELAEYKKAIDLYRQAKNINQRTGHKHFLANNSFHLGRISAKFGNKWEGQQNLQEARELYKEMGIEKGVDDCDEELRRILQIVDINPAPRMLTLDDKVQPKRPWWQIW